MRPERREPPQFSIRRIDAFALVPCAGFWAVFIWRASFVQDGRRRFTLFDDAMISMGYARTLAEGHGLVWYPGAPRVEGYTNLLWTLVMAAFHAVGLGGSGTSLAISLLGAATIAGSALIAAGIVRRLGARSRWAPPLVVLAIGFCYPLAYWTLRGMEVGLVTFLTVAGCALALSVVDAAPSSLLDRRVLGLAVVFASGVLTRTDFVVVAFAICLWIGLAVGSRRGWVVAVGVFACVVAVVAAHTVFREAYYGSALPNTYVLKMTGLPLTTRVWRGTRSLFDAALIGYVAALIVVGIAFVQRGAGTFRRECALLLAVSGAVAAYSVYVGADAWEWMEIANRYLVPGLVTLLVAGVASADRIVSGDEAARSPNRRQVLVLLTVGVTFVACFAPLAPSFIRLGVVHGFSAVHTIRALEVVLLVSIITLVATRTTRTAAVSVMAVLALAPSFGLGLRPTSDWIRHNGVHVEDDAAQVVLGDTLREDTRPGASIAFVAAGAPAYYADRRSIDLLGKSDPHVARLPARSAYVGHNKWDYRFSIHHLRPAVVAQLWQATDADRRHLKQWGYVRVRTRGAGGATFWVDEGDRKVRWQALDRAD